jgi:hypothetical protein
MKRIPLVLITGILLIPLGLTCVRNPVFDDDTIEPGISVLQGRVWLDDGSTPNGVLVWIQAFNIGVFTDDDGNFQLEIPLPSQQPGGGLNGAFDVYFYVANYRINRRTFVVLNGFIQDKQGDVGENGVLEDRVPLQKLISVSTVIKPGTILHDFQGTLKGVITLEAAYDSIFVVSRLRDDTLLAALVNPLDAPQGSMRVVEYDSVMETVDAIYTTQTKWTFLMPFEPDLYATGQWEVIPFIWVPQVDIPQAMLDFLGEQVNALGPEYLKLPFKREGGDFSILP